MAPNEESQYNIKFNQPITWQATRQIPVAELLKRLSSLAQELSSIEQEQLNLESLDVFAKQLKSQQLLSHKDRGVRAWTAHCLVDVFRLYVPNAPFTETELKVRGDPSKSRSN